MSITSYNEEENGNMTSTVEHNNNTAWYEHSDEIMITMTMSLMWSLWHGSTTTAVTSQWCNCGDNAMINNSFDDSNTQIRWSNTSNTASVLPQGQLIYRMETITKLSHDNDNMLIIQLANIDSNVHPSTTMLHNMKIKVDGDMVKWLTAQWKDDD